MGRLAFVLWLILTPIWILFCFYVVAQTDNVGYDPSSVVSKAANMAFIPPGLVLIVLVFWLTIWFLKRLVLAIRFHVRR
jgi:hypothetical protein